MKFPKSENGGALSPQDMLLCVITGCFRGYNEKHLLPDVLKNKSFNFFYENFNIIFLDSRKLKIVWRKITTFFKRRVLIIL